MATRYKLFLFCYNSKGDKQEIYLGTYRLPVIRIKIKKFEEQGLEFKFYKIEYEV